MFLGKGQSRALLLLQRRQMQFFTIVSSHAFNRSLAGRRIRDTRAKSSPALCHRHRPVNATTPGKPVGSVQMWHDQRLEATALIIMGKPASVFTEDSWRV